MSTHRSPIQTTHTEPYWPEMLGWFTKQLGDHGVRGFAREAAAETVEMIRDYLRSPVGRMRFPNADAVNAVREADAALEREEFQRAARSIYEAKRANDCL